MKCWYGRYSNNPCQNEGRWALRPHAYVNHGHGDASIIYKMCWCEDHKHPDDVLLDPPRREGERWT